MTEFSETYRESRERPRDVRRYTFEHAVLPSHRLEWEHVVPLAKVQPGDTQVRIESKRGEGIVTPFRITSLDLLADFPDVDSVAGPGRVQATRALPQIRELFVHEVDEETLANLPNLRTLQFVTAPEKRKLEARALPRTLRDLSCTAYRSIESLEPLAELQDLERLSLSSAWDHSLKPLAELSKLRWLITDPGKDLRSLAVLENLELVHLYMEQARLSNLKAFRRWTKLRELEVAERGLRSIDGIQAFEALERLFLSRTGVSELAPLVGHPTLRELKLRLPDRVKDWPPLNLPALRTVQVDMYDDPAPPRRFLDGCPAVEEVQIIGTDGPGRDPLEPFALPDGMWTIFGDLSNLLDVGSNHEAERLVRSTVKKREPDLAKRLDYDSEGSAFGVSGSEADLRRVAELIRGMATERDQTRPASS